MVQSSPKFELIYQDESGSTAALTVSFPIGSTVAEALDAATALGASVASLTGAVLVRLRIKYTYTRDELTTPDVGASITRRGIFIFTTDEVTPLCLIEIPGIKDSLFVTSGFGAGFIIDDSNTDVIAFVAQMIALPACNPFGDEALALDVAYLQSRV